MPDLRALLQQLTPNVPLPEGLNTSTSANGIDAAGDVLVYVPPNVDVFQGGGGGPPFLPIEGGTLTGPLILAGDPVVPLGAATMQYVDGAVARAGGPFLPLSGGTMVGPLNWTATNSTQSRSAQDRSADWVNVLDFGAVGDGVTDDFAAVNAARDSRPSGSEVNLWFPGNRTYLMSDAVQPNGRVLFFQVDPTSTITGNGGGLAAFYYAKYASMFQAQSEYLKINGPQQWFTAVGPAYDIYNDGTGSGVGTGYGVRTSYMTSCLGAQGDFDILRGDLMTVATPSVGAGSQWLVNWSAIMSPQDTVNGWGAFIAEWNPVNRGPDTGWANARGSLTHWTGGLQIIPESQDFSGAGGTGRNILFSYSATHSATPNANGFVAQSYNALLIEQNAIGPNGRGIYAGGYVAAANVPASPLPYAPFQADDAWQNGIVMTGATFTGNAIATPGFTVDGIGTMHVTNFIGISGTSSNPTDYTHGIEFTANGCGFTTTGVNLNILCGGGASFTFIVLGTGTIGTLNAPGLGLSGGLGLFGVAPPPKPTVSGSRGGIAALASLITALAEYGLVTDATVP